MSQTPRLTQPRRWRSLAVAGASVSLAMAAPAMADMVRSPSITLAMPNANLWKVQDQGGEAGEAGVVQGSSPGVTYLAELTLLEGHYVAAVDLYRKGQTALALELARHPEQEGMLAAVVESLAAKGAKDVSPATVVLVKTLAAGASIEDVQVALSAVQLGIEAAMAAEKDDLPVRFHAMVAVLQAAAEEYAGSITDGKVADLMAYHEANAFVGLARRQAGFLMGEPATMNPAARALDAMTAADEAFSDMSLVEVEARDPAILLSVAARVELIASSVR